MKNAFSFARSETGTALVIVFPPGANGLFNPEIHGLVREVQERLDGVHVTYALTSGGAPTLRDATAAARFAGCESVVVIHALDEGLWAHGAAAAGDWVVDAPLFSADLTAIEIVGAFTNTLENSKRAA